MTLCQTIRDKIEQSIIEKSSLDEDVTKHLQSCPDCSAYYTEELIFSQTISETLKAVPIPAPKIATADKHRYTQIDTDKICVHLRASVVAISIAAAIVLIGFTFFLFTRPSGDDAAETIKITLSDGSKIVASAKAELVIEEANRQVILKRDGELYLQITGCDQKPFQLITSAGTVIVKGTEFSVSVKAEADNGSPCPYRIRASNAPSSLTGSNKIKTSILVFVIKGTTILSTREGEFIGKEGETLYAEVYL
ncbi:MAG: FecR domain-containing protein [Planctomycetota bacterium]|nr:FecR domain-containing protein [Planctomycetota bacterium]MDI6787765.1 FecR domain-containing protein [Planctomycetota bacterium]